MKGKSTNMEDRCEGQTKKGKSTNVEDGQWSESQLIWRTDEEGNEGKVN